MKNRENVGWREKISQIERERERRDEEERDKETKMFDWASRDE